MALPRQGLSQVLVALILAVCDLTMAQVTITSAATRANPTDPYIFVTGAYGPCQNTVTGNTTCNHAGISQTATMTREVSCIRRGSFGLKLPHSFCAPYGTKPSFFKSCLLPPCPSGTTPAPATIAKAPVACQDSIVAYKYRLHMANITIYSAGDMADNTGVSSTILFPTDFKMQVIKPVFAGPVVVQYTLFRKAPTNPLPVYSGEKVGQAMTNNSFVFVSFDDLAMACDTQSKGKGTFAITMNNIVPPIPMSMDPNYFSRQKITWYWPDSRDDFPVESPDKKMFGDEPYPKFYISGTKDGTKGGMYTYGEAEQKGAVYPSGSKTYMDLRYLINRRR